MASATMGCSYVARQVGHLACAGLCVCVVNSGNLIIASPSIKYDLANTGV
jgi:hypothetical protein